jgi:hypothetical protein
LQETRKMKFKTGDRVAFINERQNGIVVKSFSDGKVLVEIEDGFEIEVYEKELVLIASTVLVEKNTEVIVAPTPIELTSSPLLQLCPTGSIIFACVPAATGAVLTGLVNYYLINNSDYDFVFTLVAKKKLGVEGITKGILGKENEILLESFRRDDLTEIEHFLIEGLLYFKNNRPTITHIRKEAAVLLPNIAQTNAGATGVAAFAKILEIYTSIEPDIESVKDLVLKLSTKEIFKNDISKPFTKPIQQNKYGIHINEKVVDLHIEEIQSDFSHFTNSEMIQIQLSYFSNEMDNAIQNHYKRIVFIHGVGNGVLKREIRNELRKYNGVTVRDGEYSKYGNGATEVSW